MTHAIGLRLPVEARVSRRAFTIHKGLDMINWKQLAQPLELCLSPALRDATEALAAIAETLAAEIDEGELPDDGGPEALRLFAGMVRTANGSSDGAGHA